MQAKEAFDIHLNMAVQITKLLLANEDRKVKEKIREIRSMTGLSQRAFAVKYNIPRRTLENWESGKAEPPAYVVDMLRKIIEMDK